MTSAPLATNSTLPKMPSAADLKQASDALQSAIAASGRGLVERSALVETVALAAVAGEHLLVIGPPGTAKSEAVRRMARSLGGQYFEYLLGRFTEPSEIFGPVDLRKLREGIVETETANMLPEAEIAFIDEVFLGSTAILNTLLGILNERVFRRGHTQVAVPLRLCVGASNGLPTDDVLAAFADRFLLRVFVDAIPDSRLEELLEGGWSLSNEGPSGAIARLQDLDTVAAAARAADLGPVRPLLAQAIRTLRQNGILLSDRRAVKVQRLVAAAAAMTGRPQPTNQDLWPLILAVPTQAEQSLARDCLRDLLAATENAALATIAEETSLGPLARARRLVTAGQALLADEPSVGNDRDAWILKLEGVAREIDAGFTAEQLPPELSDLRKAIVSAINPR
jgi:MoxR-like ATPase